MMRTPKFLCLVLIGLAAVGCTQTEKFDVTVTNRLNEPVTVWMTKEKGDNPEPGWTPPEVIAVGTIATQKIGGVAIPADMTSNIVIQGKFDSDDVAVLRVYRADDLNKILSISRGSPDRLDVPLDPGKYDMDVILKNGQLTTIPHEANAPTTAPSASAN